MNPTIILVVVALAAGANASLGWGNGGLVLIQSAPQPPSDNADVQIARAAHLAEVSRISNERLSALAAANARAAVVGGGPVIVQAAPQPPQDNVDVQIARAAHLAEVSRISNERLSALAAANARGLGLGGLALGGQVVIAAAPQAPSDNADVAIAKAAHLAEHARQTGNALNALAGAQARAIVAPGIVWANAGPRAVLVQSAPRAPQDNADVAIAKAAHLAEHARQTGNALSALASRGVHGWGK